jgi:hypothetical protein
LKKDKYIHFYQSTQREGNQPKIPATRRHFPRVRFPKIQEIDKNPGKQVWVTTGKQVWVTTGKRSMGDDWETKYG